MTRNPIERDVIEEHRRIDVQFAAVREGFVGECAVADLCREIERLQQVLDVHFGQEEALYYPALWALRPALREPLERCLVEHEVLGAQLLELKGCTDREELAAAVRAFEALAESFRRHEVREEHALHDLDREPEPPNAPG